MFAVCVEFQVKPEQLDAFLPLMRENAAASVRDEPGCHQFDVVQSSDDPALILLYELYSDAAAFDAHRETPHFRRFDAAIGNMIAAKKVHTGPRLHP